MPTKVRIATFNCENLFARFKFRKGAKTDNISDDGWDVNDTKFMPFDRGKRKITAQAIKALKTDVIALQEVENLEVLRRFRSKYLGGHKAFPYAALLDCEDPRHIDVAVLSKLPIVHVRSHMHMRNSKNRPLFSRDCLEVDVLAGKKTVTLFVNHLKSMMGGRKKTSKKREEQSKAVRKIVKDRFGSELSKASFVILGDLNDYMEKEGSVKPGISAIVNWKKVENLISRLPKEERWTHYYSRENEYRQLDYILTSGPLSKKISEVHIERRGMPLRAKRVTKRFKEVKGKLKASDHCPVVIEIKL